MTGSQEFSSEYSSEDKVNFNNYIDTQIDKIKIIHKDEDFLRQKMIEMYGNTVKNHLNSK